MDRCRGPFMVQLHTTAEEHSPQQGQGDHFPTGQGSFHRKQSRFIFASIKRCSSGFMLVNECDQGLINQSAQPKIEPGSCWELGIPSPPVCAEQEGISSAPAGCQPCAETWAAGETSRLTPLSGKITAAVCKTSLQRASRPGFSQSPGWGK